MWKLSKSLPVSAGIHKGSNLGSMFFVSYIIDTLLILSMLMILIRTLSVIGLLTCGNSYSWFLLKDTGLNRK